MKIEKTTILIFVAVTFIFGLLTNANANLIKNGSFEVGTDFPESMLLLPGGSTDINEWEVTREGIDYKGTFWEASDGVRSLDLDNSPGFGGIKQEFPTISGVMYFVTFDMAGNPYWDPNLGFDDPPIKYMRVEVDAAGQYHDFSFNVAGHDFNDMGWEERSWQFTADSDSTTIEFYTLHSDSSEGDYSGYSGWCGPALDNVSVVPEPATLSLLGLGSLVLLRKRRA